MAGRDTFEVYNYRIPYEEGARLFQQASVVALPYLEASQSGVIPTAYGFRRPVVVTDVGGSLPEVVDDGVTGYVVPPRDPEALAAAIVRLLKDPPGACRRMGGERGYAKLKTDMAWSTIARSLLAVYGELASARGGRETFPRTRRSPITPPLLPGTSVDRISLPQRGGPNRRNTLIGWPGGSRCTDAAGGPSGVTEGEDSLPTHVAGQRHDKGYHAPSKPVPNE
ncbi:glycosyltransferase [Methanoculleus chikugoensis]|uniref:glycosyltransferase n=1 Tax=Methanoculleus chikugoensis TaxID=118126 RepID=UPI0006D0D9AE|nr:glycosyltransferase family 4 protein [Methanoculleus chikugoensis]